MCFPLWYATCISATRAMIKRQQRSIAAKQALQRNSPPLTHSPCQIPKTPQEQWHHHTADSNTKLYTKNTRRRDAYITKLRLDFFLVKRFFLFPPPFVCLIFSVLRNKGFKVVVYVVLCVLMIGILILLLLVLVIKISVDSLKITWVWSGPENLSLSSLRIPKQNSRSILY